VARHAARDPGLIVSRPAAATPTLRVEPARRPLAAVALLMV